LAGRERDSNARQQELKDALAQAVARAGAAEQQLADRQQELQAEHDQLVTSLRASSTAELEVHPSARAKLCCAVPCHIYHALCCYQCRQLRFCQHANQWTILQWPVTRIDRVTVQGTRAEALANAEKEAQALISVAMADAERMSNCAAEQQAALQKALDSCSKELELWKNRANQRAGAVKALERDVQAVLKVSDGVLFEGCHILAGPAALHCTPFGLLLCHGS
jgi:hypothetical protein